MPTRKNHSTVPALGLGVADVRRLAVASECDPRTVARYLRGMPVKGLAAIRIRRTLKSFGMPDPMEL